MFCDPDPHAHTLQVTQLSLFSLFFSPFSHLPDNKDVLLPAARTRFKIYIFLMLKALRL